MEKDNRKKSTPKINEDLMMNLMAGGVKKEGIRLPPDPVGDTGEKRETEEINKKAERNGTGFNEKKRIRRPVENDYEHTFFKKSETNARDGKTVYIRPEFHEKLTRIIHVIGEDKISIYAYIDNLLDFHFREFAEQITKSYNDKYKPI